jgi:hypothetical protein
MAQERMDLGFPHRARLTHPVDAQEPPQPLLIGLHRAACVMASLQLLPVALDQVRQALVGD